MLTASKINFTWKRQEDKQKISETISAASWIFLRDRGVVGGTGVAEVSVSLSPSSLSVSLESESTSTSSQMSENKIKI